MVNMLLRGGAQVDAEDGQGRSALLCGVLGPSDSLQITPENFAEITAASPGIPSLMKQDHVAVVALLAQALKCKSAIAFARVVDGPLGVEART